MNYFDVMNDTKARLRSLDTDSFVSFVDQLKRVPQFSLMNTALIAQYAPDATEVGTETALKARGVSVEQMNTSITIIKPAGNGRGFALHEVYAATTARESRQASVALFNVLRSGCNLPVGKITSRPHATNGEALWVNPDQDAYNACLSLLTAWAHADLHFGDNLDWAKENADIARFEARTAAYVVLGAFGVETPDGAEEFTALGLNGGDLYDSVTAIKSAVSTLWKGVQDAVRTGRAPALDAA